MTGQASKRDAIWDVCEFPEYLKIFMCKNFIGLNDYGFQFSRPGSQQLKCDNQEISLRVRPQTKLKTRNIKMFRCPTPHYTSLETDEVVALPLSYYVSNTHIPGSPCLYIQHGENYPIFPLKTTSNVNLYTLISYFSRNSRVPAPESPRLLASLITHLPSVKRQFLDFQDIQKQTKSE